jgi:hypothetical protein
LAAKLYSFKARKYKDGAKNKIEVTPAAATEIESMRITNKRKIKKYATVK